LDAYSEKDVLTENESADCDAPSEYVSTASSLRNSVWKQRHNNSNNLQLAFPIARYIAIYGVWDAIRRRWLVGYLLWAYEPFRILRADTEMQFVAASCKVVTTETKRVKAVGSDEAKSDFISSMSYELRFPLHGILGSMEVLAEHKLDSTALTLVEQITLCGHTLLEIIHHLLDFANLEEQRLKKSIVKSSRINRRILHSALGAFENDFTAFEMDVVLDYVIEDVVVSSIYSFHYNHDTAGNIQTAVILNIDHSEGTA
jgi:signal transduction histidine kinase